MLILNGVIVTIQFYFIVKLSDDDYWIIETKGREDLDVAMKDQAAQCWCENATELTGKNWNSLKVNQSEFEKLKPENFVELVAAIFFN